jgi:transposase
MKDYLFKRLIFLDESGVNIAMTRRYARALKGKRARGSAPINYGKNITMLGALDRNGMVAVMTVDGPTDSDVFMTFIDQILIPEVKRGDVIIMDNLGVHKIKAVQDAIDRIGAELIFLPPYSPDLSPIEKAWSKVKTYLRKISARTRECLDTAISEAIELITNSDSQAWFKHCGYCSI